MPTVEAHSRHIIHNCQPDNPKARLNAAEILGTKWVSNAGGFMTKIASAVAAVIAAACLAAPANADTPLVVARKSVEQHSAVLPANTEVLVAMNETITTRGKRFSEGDTFEMSVVNDVMLGDYVVIPKGSRAIGWISWLTSKAVFGKSGKVEITIEYVQVGNRRIPLTGRHRQAGEGNTVATVAAVVTFGWASGFLITGKSGSIYTGTHYKSYTKEDLPVQFASPAALASVPPMVTAQATFAPPETPQLAQSPAATTVIAQPK